MSWSRREALVLALLLGLPPLLLQSLAPVPRIDADAVDYYAHLRSLYFDRDLDFANEFAHFGILSRYDKRNPTATGHRRTIFTIGPALLWLPFYAAGDLWARAAGDVEDGYSEAHIRSVCLASLAYGVAGLLLVYGLLRERASPGIALWTVVLLEYATFLVWYLTYEPVMSHALSFFLAAAALAVWWPARDALSLRRSVALGLLIGLAATVRFQNGLLLLLPAAALLPRLWREPARTLRTGVATLAAFALGVLPQLLAWKAIFGSYLLESPPQGTDYLRLSHPYLLETFFSSRHGLLYWTPLLWAALAGLLAFARREGRAGATLLLLLAVTSWVNASSADWWGGGAFSNRRFDAVLPVLALGLATALGALQALARRRPGLLLAAAGAALTLWNLLFMQTYRENRIARDDTVSFADVARHNAEVLAELAGTPFAWPANWIFAWRTGLPAARYDLTVGKYLFYRQGSLGGVIDLGDDRADPALLGEGWTAREPCGSAVCRRIQERARLFAPLDLPEELDLTVVASGSSLAVAVNGHPLGVLPLEASLVSRTLRVPAGLLISGLNEVALAAVGGPAAVDRLVFVRVGRR